jgi:hypothetical protein
MASLTRVRVRRLPGVGVFKRTPVYEVEITEPVGPGPARIEQLKRPYDLLESLLGWDETALVTKRADEAVHGGDMPGPWVDA